MEEVSVGSCGRGGGGLGKKEEKETRGKTQTSDQPISPLSPRSLIPVSAEKSDPRSADRVSPSTLRAGTQTRGNRVPSAARSARQDSSTAEHGEGTDKEAAKAKERLVGPTEEFNAEAHPAEGKSRED